MFLSLVYNLLLFLSFFEWCFQFCAIWKLLSVCYYLVDNLYFMDVLKSSFVRFECLNPKRILSGLRGLYLLKLLHFVVFFKFVYMCLSCVSSVIELLFHFDLIPFLHFERNTRNHMINKNIQTKNIFLTNSIKKSWCSLVFLEI